MPEASALRGLPASLAETVERLEGGRGDVECAGNVGPDGSFKGGHRGRVVDVGVGRLHSHAQESGDDQGGECYFRVGRGGANTFGKRGADHRDEARDFAVWRRSKSWRAFCYLAEATEQVQEQWLVHAFFASK
jgi:hypothetical protein